MTCSPHLGQIRSITSRGVPQHPPGAKRRIRPAACPVAVAPVFTCLANLHDPSGVVTDYCLKLTYSKQLNQVTVGTQGVYGEYMVVYGASY